MKITLTCCLCSARTDVEAETPDGWELRYSDIDEDKCFCPKHVAVAEFARSQCPGCISGWGNDCPLFRAFAYSGSRNLAAGDFAKIEGGICPKRVNGTISFSHGRGIEDVDLSDRAPAPSGVVLSQAIRDYWVAYPETV